MSGSTDNGVVDVWGLVEVLASLALVFLAQSATQQQRGMMARARTSQAAAVTPAYNAQRQEASVPVALAVTQCVSRRHTGHSPRQQSRPCAGGERARPRRRAGKRSGHREPEAGWGTVSWAPRVG